MVSPAPLTGEEIRDLRTWASAALVEGVPPSTVSRFIATLEQLVAERDAAGVAAGRALAEADHAILVQAEKAKVVERILAGDYEVVTDAAADAADDIEGGPLAALDWALSYVRVAAKNWKPDDPEWTELRRAESLIPR